MHPGCRKPPVWSDSGCGRLCACVCESGSQNLPTLGFLIHFKVTRLASGRI